MGKRILSVLSLALVLITLDLGAQMVPPELSLAALPRTPEEFLALREVHGSSPAGAAALFTAALITYSENPEAGLPMLILILVNDGSLLQSATAGQGYRGYDLSRNTRYLIDRVLTAPWIPRSYVQGTSPANQYTIAPGPLRFAFSSNNYSQVSPDEVRIFITSTGADSPRPLRLKRNDAGLWKVAEFSSLVVGVRAPASGAQDDL